MLCKKLWSRPRPLYFVGWGWDNRDGSQAIVSVGCIGGHRLPHSRQFLHSRTERRNLLYLKLPVQLVRRKMVSSKWHYIQFLFVIHMHIIQISFYVMPCRKADRILYYNYTVDYIERNVTREVTTRVFKCPPGVPDSHKWYVKPSALLYTCIAPNFLIIILRVNKLAAALQNLEWSP